MPLRGRADARYGGAESPGRPSREHVDPGKADTAPKAPRAPEAVQAARLALSRMTPGPPCLLVMPRKPSRPPGGTASTPDRAAIVAGRCDCGQRLLPMSAASPPRMI